MTVKQSHTLNHWWSLLVACCNEKDGYVSAGELAKFAGVARSTAQKHLIALKKEKAATSTTERHNAAVRKTVYKPEMMFE